MYRLVYSLIRKCAAEIKKYSSCIITGNVLFLTVQEMETQSLKPKINPFAYLAVCLPHPSSKFKKYSVFAAISTKFKARLSFYTPVCSPSQVKRDSIFKKKKSALWTGSHERIGFSSQLREKIESIP